MSHLERMIREKRKELDGHEPPDGHFRRFGQRLSGTAIIRGITLMDYLKIAAVVVLASIFSFLTYSSIESAFPGRDEFSLSDISTEYAEVEDYYTRLISSRYAELEQLTGTDPEQVQMLIQELSEMDLLKNNLQKDLRTHPHDERVINAMITHYQIKLEIMNQVLEQLENIHNYQKATDYESQET